jgi:hypothetical protein
MLIEQCSCEELKAVFVTFFCLPQIYPTRWTTLSEVSNLKGKRLSILQYYKSPPSPAQELFI